MSALAQRLLDPTPLDADAAHDLLTTLASDAPEADRRGLLLAMSHRALDAAELASLALALRDRSVPVAAPEGAADTAGTGGDGSHTVNLSTAAALVVAAAGVPVVKHGNRAVSGRCGSADVVEALGIPVAETPAQAEAQLAATGFTFLFAPAFHPVMSAVGPLRRSLGVRTAFNVLGPLINPAQPAFQLVGAWSSDLAETLASTLTRLPVRRAVTVHGAPGWDEATPCGNFHRWTVEAGEVRHLEVEPRFSYGVHPCAPEDLAGGDANENAAILEGAFSGVHGPVRDAIALNAALLLEVAGAAQSPTAAWALAHDVLDSGAAAWLLDRLRATLP